MLYVETDDCVKGSLYVCSFKGVWVSFDQALKIGRFRPAITSGRDYIVERVDGGDNVVQESFQVSV